MQYRKFLLCLIFVLGSALTMLRADVERTMTLSSAMNMFLAKYSADEIAWQSEIQLERGNIEEISLRIAPPRRLGISEICGAYSYRPVTWVELSKDEKKYVLGDSRLAVWLEWFRKGHLVSIPTNLGASPKGIQKDDAR